MSNGQLLPQFFIDGRSGMPAICLLYKFGDHLPGYPAAGTLICKKQRPASYARGVSGRILAIGDRTGAGYNVNQSKIAIGSGGLTGKGFLNGTQTKLKYVPEQDTDFIFCTVGEEQGFVGSAAVLLAFLILILRLIFLSERQPSAFGRVYGYSVVSIFLFHLFINIGMVLGLTPVIGIPLPFFSYGGSSLWGFTILLFIFLRIDAGRGRRL